MELAMIGLGKMGGNMTIRLVRGGHRVVAYARDPNTVQSFVQQGAVGAGSLADVVKALSPPRVIWLMVPTGPTVDQTLAAITPMLSPGDYVIDGGNSYYKDTVRRADAARAKGLHYVDSGTSGGIWGLTEGYSMMVGGDPADVAHLRPIFETLAPSATEGWGRVGPVGSGHFTKMVHNGIEYGMMEAYAEGFSILNAKSEFSLDLHQVAEIWRKGSVVRSWLLDLTSEALAERPNLAGIAPVVDDTGEGRWTVFEAIDLNIAAPVITLALDRRIRSRETDPYVERMLAVMRLKFGGHAIHPEPTG